MAVGDLVDFHNLTFHRSLANQSDHIRWSIDFRYSAVGTPLDQLWHETLAFTARSAHQTQRTESWPAWQAKWDASEHKSSRL